MKKYYKIEITLKQKDESQIPEEIRKTLQDPNSNEYFGYVGAVFQNGKAKPSRLSGVYGVESDQELEWKINDMLIDYKTELFDITINKEESKIGNLIEKEIHYLKNKVITKYINNHRNDFDNLSAREYSNMLCNPDDELYYNALVENNKKDFAESFIDGRYNPNKITLAQYKEMVALVVDANDDIKAAKEALENYILEHNIDCKRKVYSVFCGQVSPVGEKYSGVAYNIYANSEDEAINYYKQSFRVSEDAIKEKDLKFVAEEVKEK